MVRSIQARIASCVIAILLLLVLSAGMSWLTGQRVLQGFGRLGVAFRATADIAAAVDATALVQLRVKEYVGSETGKDRSAVSSAITDLETVLGKMPTRTSSAVAKLLDTVSDLSGTVSDIFAATIARHAAGAQIADTGAALSGILVGARNASSRQINSDIVAGLNVAATDAQRASLFSTRYMVSSSPSDIAAAKADMSNALAQLNGLVENLKLEDGSRSSRQLNLATGIAHQLSAGIDILATSTASRSASITRLDGDIRFLRSSMEAMKREFDHEAQGLERELVKRLQQASLLIASFTIFAVLMGAVCILVIRSACIKPLIDLVNSVRTLAAGDLSVSIAYTQRSDEIGEVARALDSLRRSAADAQVAQSQAAAFTSELIEDRRRVIQVSADATEKALGELARSVGRTTERLADAADELSSIAGETSGRAADVVLRSLDGRVRAEQVSTEAGRLADQIGRLEGRITSAAAGTAKATVDAMETETSVRSLAGATDGVEAATRLIAQVAKRTRLLALNAAIEAAGSGEAGRGFTVVATEVKALAVQTAAATEEITHQVHTMRLAVGGSADRIYGIRETVASVNQLTLDVADTFREQHAFMQGFVVAAAESASKAGMISETMEAVLQSTAEVVRSADGLRQVASEVAMQGSVLDTELGKVVGQLRAT